MKKRMGVFLLLLSLTASAAWAETVWVIDVEGMTCKLCPIAIRKSLSRIKGVKWVKTSLKNRIAVVVSEDAVPEEALLQAISRAGGYKGRVIGKTRF
ncbi:heavy-metal-associated domain-containing protein [Thermosulfurimonas marina]|uniref:Heavy-metal-associated domain-containing protein n=1 Tax=Thermosulfurimonas marina TaxID=2047767 RepID=A0A6H1WS79_9BACT|nr:heavy metal-associated domain-containing protein [Thermosulfurimonas marina]QJA06028.1 heavy-metal-associated domain-containing protein [Thermosulfurimonas marina]